MEKNLGFRGLTKIKYLFKYIYYPELKLMFKFNCTNTYLRRLGCILCATREDYSYADIDSIFLRKKKRFLILTLHCCTVVILLILFILSHCRFKVIHINIKEKELCREDDALASIHTKRSAKHF